MNWNTEKFQELVRSRTLEEAKLILPPQEPELNSNFGDLTQEEVELSSILSEFDSTGIVGRIRTAFEKLAELSPEIKLVEQDKLGDAMNYVNAREQYLKDVEQWEETVGGLDMEISTKARLPILSVLQHEGSSPRLVISESYRPRLLTRGFGIDQGSEYLNRYEIPSQSDLEDFISSIDPNSVRNYLSNYLNERQFAELEELLGEPGTVREDQPMNEDEALDSVDDNPTTFDTTCNDPYCSTCN